MIETFTFRSLHRVYIRDPIVGALIASPVLPDDPEAGDLSVRVFGITSTGVLQLEWSHADLQ